MKENEQFCIIVGNTVTGICIAKMTGPRNKCMEANQATIMPLPTNHTSISGTLMHRAMLAEAESEDCHVSNNLSD
ncbi:hypothetical protein KIN20_020263 [Parelaphostrongylus tenuis]|uniref:Uncharacterized protein n=1 Tax=Parelaphostrongylus tenuis TaxID=148309 RepID=A0AAD5N317_PARTN|nr:hypothetical protein KIN20_020263 [Parelaphostrongylus tenuis]